MLSDESSLLKYWIFWATGTKTELEKSDQGQNLLLSYLMTASRTKESLRKIIF